MQVIQKKLKFNESTNTLLKYQSQDYTLASTLKDKENQFRQWSSKESFDIPISISFPDHNHNNAKDELLCSR